MPRRLRVKFPPSAARLLSALRGTFTLSGVAATLTTTSVPPSFPFTLQRSGLTVGIYPTLQSAITAAQSGDTIIGVPGTYTGNYPLANITKSLTIKSSAAGQKVVLSTQGLPYPGSRGVVEIGAAGLTVVLEDIGITGNHFAYSNFGVGLYVLSNNTTLTALRCEIYENSNGVAGGDAVTGGTILLENCEIHDNGDDSGLYHNIYMSKVDSFTLRGCWLHHNKNSADYPGQTWKMSWGHLLKSRSKALTVEACRLTTELDYNGINRCIDYPNGGALTVRGCLIEYRTNQNNGGGQAISWGIEGANRIAGSTFDGRSFSVHIEQNTIVARSPNILPGSSNKQALFIGAGCITDDAGASDWPNKAVTPVPTTYSVTDNYFCGWLDNPPTVIYGPSRLENGVYAISTTTNTCGALSLLTNAATYDYTPVSGVPGTQNWTRYAYSHPTNTVTRTDNFRGGVAGGDGTVWATGTVPGNLYKGNQTFSSLAVVAGSIGSSGGWAQIPGTKISDQFISGTALDQISPFQVLRQNFYPHHANVAWGSAAWNGYGWFWMSPKGHNAGYINDLYAVRVADPVGIVKLHDAAPILAAARKSNNTLVDPAQWSALTELTGSWTQWGPTNGHAYQGLVWDSSREILVAGGDGSTWITNPTAYGSTPQTVSAIFKFSPYAATPKQAWTRTTFTQVTYPSVLPLIKVGTVFNFNTYLDYNGQRYTYDPDGNGGLGAVTATSPSVPPPNRYHTWRPVFQDAASGKWYELNYPQPNLSNGPDTNAVTLYEVPSYTKVADIPTTAFYNPSVNLDDMCTPIVVNGKAYIIQQASAGVAAGLGISMQMGITEVNLSTGAVKTFNDARTFTTQSANTSNMTITGLWGRIGYIPDVLGAGQGAFTVILDAEQNIWVWRPPSSWGL